MSSKIRTYDVWAPEPLVVMTHTATHRLINFLIFIDLNAISLTVISNSNEALVSETNITYSGSMYIETN